jgi:ATP-binding cassette subfamily B (MDR/TAP) protein 1
VRQPVLFGTTIYENIRHGLIGTPHERSSQEIQEQMIFKAAKTANIHDFILALPNGYQTQVGQRGLLMSGGEKQRIAISRAVVSDPKILLLDEATSALDTKSEEVVQAALNAAAKGRTTIIIAHRLSTIKNAEKIVMMSGGSIVEKGTHDVLLGKKAAYYTLVQAQEMSKAGSEEDHEDELTKAEDALYDRHINKEHEVTTSPTAATTSLSGNETPVVYSSWKLLGTFAAFNSREWPIMLIGLIFSILAGGTYPTQSLFFAKSVSSLALPPAQFAELRSDINFWSWMYFMLAVVAFINFLIQGVALGYGSSKLTSRVASRAFRDIIKQDVSFFDQDENTVGSLTSFLATQPASLSGFSGSTLGAILNVLSTIISALALSLAISWKLGLVCGATIPVLLASGFYRFWIAAELARRSKKAYALSASFAAEATSAIRTIASLTRERDVLKLYHKTLVGEQRLALATTLKSANLYALSQSFPYLCMALGFWYGGHLISNGEIGMFEFYLCYNALIFTIQSAGRVLAFAPELGKAKNAAVELKALFDRIPKIHSSTQLGVPLGKIEGHLEFRDVHFSYSSRADVRVLRGLNFKVTPGQYAALVGASGCGKSTVLALLERFYDPSELFHTSFM